MKATIKKIVKKDGDHFFYIYKDGEFVSCQFFDPTREAEGYSSETKAMERAMQTAKLIESGKDHIEEIVYQTPDPLTENQKP